jgi:DNA-binding NtrC family response regulator
VEVSSTLLTEGEQEHLGFTLRTVEPPRPNTLAWQPQAWPGLNTLRAQVGSVPLHTLLREGTALLERQIIRTALGLAGGQVEAAARLLAVEPQLLTQRLQALDLASDSGDDDSAAPHAPIPPHSMN